MHKIEKIIKMVKGKNCSNVRFMKEWQQLGVIVCFISVSRFQGFLNSENSLSITLALLKSMEYLLRQPCAAMFEPVLRIFTIWMCSFFLVSQHSSKDNRHKEFYTYHIFWNSIGGLDSGEGKSCLLQGLVKSSNNINSIPLKMCEGFCDNLNSKNLGILAQC